MAIPRVAIVAVGHAIYFTQFEGLKEELMLKSDLFMQYLDQYSIWTQYFGYVDTVDTAIECVQKIKREDPDLLFIIMSTYVPSAIVAPFILHIQTPHVLVGIQPLEHLDYANTTTYMQLVNDDICAMPEVAGVYDRLGRRIPEMIIASSAQQKIIEKQVGQIIRAVSAMTAFKYTKIGYLGHTYEGMYDMHTDPTAFTRDLGAHVQMLEMCELARYVDEAKPYEIQQRIDEIENIFDIQEPSQDPLTDYVHREDLIWSATLSIALDKLVERNCLSALAYYYKGENGNRYEQIASGLIIGNTLLTSKGIPLAGEADLKTAAAMLIMKHLGGGGSFAEIHPFDTRDDIVLVGHDGPHNISISEGKPILRKLKKYHGKAGEGIGVEFSIKAGPVTLLSMSVNRLGRMRLVAASGLSIRGAIPQTGNTNTRVKFDMPVTEFLKQWCSAAPTHHFALGIGNHIDELRLFAKFVGIELVIIGG
ncbi:MAG: L-arabinose isomerase family protein [Christensenellales bacterium]|jgi:L-arabinose isomerase